MSACLLLDPFQNYLRISVVFGIHMYSQCKHHCWEWKCVTVIFFF